MGLFNFWKKPSAPRTPDAADSAKAESDPLSSADAGSTQIDREHFVLHVPFQWVAVPGDNPLEFEFRNQTLREQLIVTVLLTQQPADAATRRSMAERLASLRLRGLDTLSNGRAVHSPVKFQTGSDQAEARCAGRDDANKVRFAFVIRATATKVVTVALTRYFLEEVGAPFDAYAGLIFDLVQVK